MVQQLLIEGGEDAYLTKDARKQYTSSDICQFMLYPDCEIMKTVDERCIAEGSPHMRNQIHSVFSTAIIRYGSE